MLIGGLQKLTLIDYPGKIACTVFTVGCNFRCPFCHNPELVRCLKVMTTNKERANKKMVAEGFSFRYRMEIPAFGLRLTSDREFFVFLKLRQGLLDGVCVTGGEPLLHKDLPEFLKKIRDLDFLVKLDTNGTKPDELQKLIKSNLVDYVAMDIKAPFVKPKNPKIKKSKNLYEKVCGVKVNLDSIKKSIKIIRTSGLDYEFRTTVVPGLHTTDDIIDIAKEIRGAKRYYLQQFRPAEKLLDGLYQKIKPYSIQTLERIRNQIRTFFDVCELRT